MADFTLVCAPPLAGYTRQNGTLGLRAPDDLAIVSIALPLGQEAAAQRAIAAAYGVALPEIGQTALAGEGNDTRLLRLGSDLAFVLFSCATPDAETRVAALLNGAAYTTDQSDVWCALVLSGPQSRAVLERICPLDLHDSAFGVGAVARTMMEHLGVIIIRTDPDSYLLLSASSSAQSFLHALETSVANVL